MSTTMKIKTRSGVSVERIPAGRRCSSNARSAPLKIRLVLMRRSRTVPELVPFEACVGTWAIAEHWQTWPVVLGCRGGRRSLPLSTAGELGAAAAGGPQSVTSTVRGIRPWIIASIASGMRPKLRTSVSIR